MAVINTTREFFDEVDLICTALEAMRHWVDSESQDVGSAQYPLLRRLREVLDSADGLCGAAMREVNRG